MQNKTLRSNMLGLLNFRLLNLVIAMVVAMAIPAQAERYQCTFKVKSWQKEVVPETLSIRWANSLSTPVIPSLIINKHNFGQVQLEADAFKNKVTFSWQLPPFRITAVLTHMNFPDSRQPVSVIYHLSISQKTGKAVFNIIPTTRYQLADGSMRIKGQCIKGQCKIGK